MTHWFDDIYRAIADLMINLAIVGKGHNIYMEYNGIPTISSEININTDYLNRAIDVVGVETIVKNSLALAKRLNSTFQVVNYESFIGKNKVFTFRILNMDNPDVSLRETLEMQIRNAEEIIRSAKYAISLLSDE